MRKSNFAYSQKLIHAIVSIPWLPITASIYTRLHCECRKNLIFLPIIRPHRSTKYVDAAYCYRPSSVVCLSVCLSVTLVSPAKTAAPIEMPFDLGTRVDPRNHVLDGDPDPLWEGAILMAEMGAPL